MNSEGRCNVYDLKRSMPRFRFSGMDEATVGSGSLATVNNGSEFMVSIHSSWRLSRFGVP